MAPPPDRRPTHDRPSTDWTPRARDELLAQVRSRGTQIRRRRHAVVGGVVSLVVLLVIVPVLASPRRDTRELATNDPTSSTRPTAPAPTEAELEVLPPEGTAQEPASTTSSAVAEPDDATSSSTTPDAPSSTEPPGAGEDRGEPTTAPAPPTSKPPLDPSCRQSFKPSCGPFAWQTPPFPDVQPLMTLTTKPDPPTQGQAVTFLFTVTDPDGPVADECFTFSTGDGAVYTLANGTVVAGAPTCAAPECAPPTGLWEAPQRVGETRSFTVVHRYAQSGHFQLSISARASGSGTCVMNPYADGFDVTYRVSVQPAPDES